MARWWRVPGAGCHGQLPVVELVLPPIVRERRVVTVREDRALAVHAPIVGTSRAGSTRVAVGGRLGRSAADPQCVFVRQQMLTGSVPIRGILPLHLIEARESASEVRQIDPPVNVVVGKVTRFRPIPAHVDDCECLVGERVNVRTCPRSAGGHGR